MVPYTGEEDSVFFFKLIHHKIGSVFLFDFDGTS